MSRRACRTPTCCFARSSAAVSASRSASSATSRSVGPVGAAGVPCVATDVGACRELIEGRSDEAPPLGPGGVVTPLSDPHAVAQGLAALLLDPVAHERCARAMRERTRLYYNKTAVDASYRELYEQHLMHQQPIGVAALEH